MASYKFGRGSRLLPIPNGRGHRNFDLYDDILEVPSEVGPPKEASGIEFRVSRYRRKSGKHARRDRKADFCCIDDNGQVVEVLRRPNPSSKPYPQPARVSAEIREAVPAVFIDVDRSSTYHLSGAPRSILGRLPNRVSAELKGNTQIYEEFQEKFEAAREVLRTDTFVELETKVVEQLKRHTGLEGVEVLLDEVDPINVYRTFSVLFMDSSTEHPIDAERMGSGIQSAVVISLLQAYRETSKENAVLLFEEPELFLHAHGRRHLFRLLCELEKAGAQVIYTTHSQDLVDLQHLDSVHLVSSTTADRCCSPESRSTAEQVARPVKSRQALRKPTGRGVFRLLCCLGGGPH